VAIRKRNGLTVKFTKSRSSEESLKKRNLDKEKEAKGQQLWLHIFNPERRLTRLTGSSRGRKKKCKRGV